MTALGSQAIDMFNNIETRLKCVLNGRLATHCGQSKAILKHAIYDDNQVILFHTPIHLH